MTGTFAASITAEPIGDDETQVTYRVQNKSDADVDSEVALYIDGEIAALDNLSEDVDDELDAEDLEPGDISVDYTHRVPKRDFAARVFVGPRGSTSVGALNNATAKAIVRDGVAETEPLTEPESETTTRQDVQESIRQLEGRVADARERSEELRSRADRLENENRTLRNEIQVLERRKAEEREERVRVESEPNKVLGALIDLAKILLGR